MANKVLTHNLSEALGGATTALIDIDAGTGNLTIDRLAGGEQTLASGALQYWEKQGEPTHALDVSNGRAVLTLSGRGGMERSRFRFPWAACNGAFEWQVHINPSVPSEVVAHSGGGNVKLDLVGMAVTRVQADTGGGNMDVVLPDVAANLNITAKTGAGNVSVWLPSGVAARIHATSGLGKVIMDPRFSRTAKDTYQSPDYDTAPLKADLTLQSGAGNVRVEAR